MESLREEQEIASWELIKGIARFTEPGKDPEDDAEVLRNLINAARDIVAGRVGSNLSR